MYKFNHAKSKLGYTMYQKLESGFEQLLQSTANDEWSTIKGTVQPGINTAQSFNARIEAVHLIYTPEPAAIENQKSYLSESKRMLNYWSLNS